MGIILSLALKGTYTQPSREAINGETEGPSFGKAALRVRASWVLYSLPSCKLNQPSVFRYQSLNPRLATQYACTEPHAQTSQPPLGDTGNAKYSLDRSPSYSYSGITAVAKFPASEVIRKAQLAQKGRRALRAGG